MISRFSASGHYLNQLALIIKYTEELKIDELESSLTHTHWRNASESYRLYFLVTLSSGDELFREGYEQDRFAVDSKWSFNM